jgi:hypothetical protein
MTKYGNMNYTKLFEEVLRESKDRNNKKSLREQLVIANEDNYNQLLQQIEDNFELKERLTNPAKDIPYYKFLIEELPLDSEESSLLDIIVSSMEQNKYTPLLCKTNNRFTAFIAYIDRNDIIEDLKVFSFLDEKYMNITLAKDLIKFIDNKFETVSIITWEALKDNPAVVGYNKVCKMFGLNIPDKYENCKEIKHPYNNKMFQYILKKEYYTYEYQQFVKNFYQDHKLYTK